MYIDCPFLYDMNERIKSYLEMAIACNSNARKLYYDSIALKKRRSIGHAHALQILAIEESVKAIIYRMAADGVVSLSNDSRKKIGVLREEDLMKHKVKHEILANIILSAVLYSPFSQAFDDVKEESIRVDQAKAIMTKAIAMHQRLVTDLQDPKSLLSKDLTRFIQFLSALNDEKNRSFYVDKKNFLIVTPNQIKSSKYHYWRKFLEDLLETTNELVKSGINPDQAKFLKESRIAISRRIKSMENDKMKDAMTSTP